MEITPKAMDLTPQAWEIEIIRSKRLSHKDVREGCESLGIGLPEFVLYGRSCLRCLYHIGFRYFKALPSEKALPTFSPTFR